MKKEIAQGKSTEELMALAEELGRGYCHVDAARTVNEKDAVFRHLESRLGSRIVEGAVLSRDLSPWALINPERYDFISPPGGTKK